MTPSIRFPHSGFAELRARLLQDPSREAFAVLLGKREIIGDCWLLKVLEVRYPRSEDYTGRSIAHLGLRRDYIHDLLCEVTERLDVDTLIDVHTHPFCPSRVAFSGTDDRDEIHFLQFLNDTFEGLHYASIVLSRSDYSARIWRLQDGRPQSQHAMIKTQTAAEAWPSADLSQVLDPDYLHTATDSEHGFLARSALALGLDTLRRIMHDQSIALVGVGGLGSLIAENLVHMGFHDLHLIDPDTLEVSNLNRITGAYYQDAIERRAKAEVVRRHLERINPHARITAHVQDIHDQAVDAVVAGADWIIVATDNHASRFRAQQLSARFFVPLLSVGVNITVTEGVIADMSGEVITARAGDRLCLNCLGRLNPIKIAAEQHPSQPVRHGLVNRGYVTGQEVKEPAVKTLNAILASLAVETLINQYTERQPHSPILGFENNRQPLIYEDKESVSGRNKACFTCHF